MEGKKFDIEPLELYKIMTEQISEDKRISEQLAMEIILELEKDEVKQIEIKKEISEDKRQQARKQFYINFKAVFVLLVLILIIMTYFYFFK